MQDKFIKAEISVCGNLCFCFSDFDLRLHQVDCKLCLFDNSQIVVVGAHLTRLLEVNPDVAVDFLLLNNNVVGERSGEEEHHPLADFAERAVLADFAEARGDCNVETGLLLNLADGGFLLGFAFLDMSLRKAPVPAVVVFNKQYFCVLLGLVENNCSAGFFVKTAD